MVKKIPVADLRPGMQVVRLDEEAWLQSPGLYMVEGVVESLEQVEHILALGYSEVLVAERPRYDRAISAEVFREEFSRARRVCRRAITVASQLVMNVAQGKPVDVAAPKRVVGEMLQGMDGGSDALVCLARLSRVDAYLCSHMVGVTVISLAFGMHLGMAEDQLRQLGLSAFVHDIGMTRLPLDILSGHVGIMEPDEQEIRKHPVFGVGLLRSVRGLSKEIRRAVLEHHENHDGSGYPDGLSGDGIGRFARIVHLADVYDALTSGHVRGQAHPPAQALARMYSMGGAVFSQFEVDRFIKCLGVYPAGSLVRLDSGEVAVVLRTNREAPLSPLVQVVQGGKGEPTGPRMLDLACRRSEAGVSVKEVVHDPRLDTLAASVLAS